MTYTSIPYANKTQQDIQRIAKMYYPAVGSHGWNDHITDVYNTAIKLKKADLTNKEYAAVLLHDIARKQQDKDHNVAGAYLAFKELNKNKLFNPTDRKDIRQAILEHSSSWRKKNNIQTFSNDAAKLLALADKGRVFPDVRRTAERAVKFILEGSYARSKAEKGKPMDIDVNDDEQVANKVVDQLQHWFGEGHIGPSNEWSDMYKKEIQQRAAAVNKMTASDVINIIRNYRQTKVANITQQENTVYDSSRDSGYKLNFNIDDSTKTGLYSGITAALLTSAFSKKNKLRNGLLAGLAGFGVGFGGKSIYDVLQGTAYNTDLYKIPDTQDVYIGVSGAGDGQGSYMHRDMQKRFGKGNVAMFRWSDRKKLNDYIKAAVAADKRIHLYGHSYGGATAAQEAANSNAPIYELNTFDPVSWTNRVLSKPKNVTIWNNYIPGNTNIKDGDNIIAAIGGRWLDRVNGTKRLERGTHGNTDAWLL